MNVTETSSLYDTLKKQKTYTDGYVNFHFTGKNPVRIVFYKEEYYLIISSKSKGETMHLYIGYLKKPEHLTSSKKNALLVSLKEGDMYFVFHSHTQAARQHQICDQFFTEFYFVHGVKISKDQFENKLALKQKIKDIE